MSLQICHRFGRKHLLLLRASVAIVGLCLGLHQLGAQSDPESSAIATTNSKTSLWESATTTQTLDSAFSLNVWEALTTHSEVVVMALEEIRSDTPFGEITMIQPVEGREKLVDPAQAQILAQLLLNPETYSRPLTPEDLCQSPPQYRVKFVGAEVILETTFNPHCQEVIFAAFNPAAEPLGEFRIGYGPGKNKLIPVLRQILQDIVPAEALP
jgi:hypothetical protein